jgi:hypothetical protein
MKYYSTDDTLKYPWNQVAVAFWQRYPNPYSKHVLSEDTFVRKVANGLLESKRLLTKTNPIPKWGRKYLHVRDVGVVEESLLDAEKKTLVTYTRNVGLLGVMTVDEKVYYTQDPDNPNLTHVKREAWINSQMTGFSLVLQRFGLERFKHNAINATKGFVTVLNRLYPAKSIISDDGLHKMKGGKILTKYVEKVKEVAKTPKEVL